ncbi:MAG: hypothetical protein AAGA97_13190, partial [Pseudomonadota bacterium]
RRPPSLPPGDDLDPPHGPVVSNADAQLHAKPGPKPEHHQPRLTGRLRSILQHTHNNTSIKWHRAHADTVSLATCVLPSGSDLTPDTIPTIRKFLSGIRQHEPVL